jgi:hypothetical protein
MPEDATTIQETQTDDPFDFGEVFDGPEVPAPETDETPDAAPPAEPVEEGDGGEQAEAESLSHEMLAMAENLGIEESVARTLGESVLARILDAAEPRPSSEQDDRTDQTAELVEPLKVEMSEDEIDPETISVIDEVQAYLNKTIGPLHARINELESREQTRLKAMEIERFDQRINALGDEWKKEFGQGSTEALSPRTNAGKNRNALKAEIESIRAGREATGQSPLDESVLFNRALGALFSDKFNTIARNELNQKAAAHHGRKSRRPSAQKANQSTPTGRSAGIDAARKVARELGQDHLDKPGVIDDSMFEGLPG